MYFLNKYLLTIQIWEFNNPVNNFWFVCLEFPPKFSPPTLSAMVQSTWWREAYVAQTMESRDNIKKKVIKRTTHKFMFRYRAGDTMHRSNRCSSCVIWSHSYTYNPDPSDTNGSCLSRHRRGSFAKVACNRKEKSSSHNKTPLGDLNYKAGLNDTRFLFIKSVYGHLKFHHRVQFHAVVRQSVCIALG